MVALGGSSLFGVAITKLFDHLTSKDKGQQEEFERLIDILKAQGEATGTNLGMLINHILSDVSTSVEAIKDLRTGLEECKKAHERCEEENLKVKSKIEELKLEIRGK